MASGTLYALYIRTTSNLATSGLFSSTSERELCKLASSPARNGLHGTGAGRSDASGTHGIA